MEGTVWIIGATGALGTATARTFRRSGWKLALAARSESRLHALETELKAEGPAVGPAARPEQSVWISAVDASEPGPLEALFARWAQAPGLPDACIHLAGGYAGGRALDEWRPEQWRAMFDLNFWGPVWTFSWVLGELRRNGRKGVLLAVGAVAALDPGKGKAPYAVSKAGLLHLVRAVAAEGEPYGIRANAVIPTILDTEANRLAMATADPSQWTSVDDAARVLLWLSSEEARTINGGLIPI